MKKKFLISGAAVFLAVCLLTSALFAFADSYPITYFEYEDGVFVNSTSFDSLSPVARISTSSGGSYTVYSQTSSFVYVFPSFLNVFFSTNPEHDFLYFDSFPSIGGSFVSNRISLAGSFVDDYVNGNPIYRYDLPNDHPYYGSVSVVIYSPPLFKTVNSFISGFFTAAGDFFDGVMSVPVLAILVIGVPVTGLITAITLSLTVGRKKNKTYKKSRRRR